jgi:hypothetical protein
MTKDQEQDEQNRRAEGEVALASTGARPLFVLRRRLVAVVGHLDPTDLLIRPA